MTINTSAIIAPVVTIPGQLNGAERLGLGQFTTIPQIDRPVAVLEETAAQRAFMERQQLNTAQTFQPPRTSAEWGMRMRISAASVAREEQSAVPKRAGSQDDDDGGDGGDEDNLFDHRLATALSRRVQIAVRFGLAGEEVGRQLNITV